MTNGRFCTPSNSFYKLSLRHGQLIKSLEFYLLNAVPDTKDRPLPMENGGRAVLLGTGSENKLRGRFSFSEAVKPAT